MIYGYRTIALMCLLAGSAVAGPLYKVVQEDGTVVYTDQPGPNAEEVVFDSKTANTSQRLATPPPPPLVTEKFNQTQTLDYQLSIVSPQPEATIRNSQGSITIKAQSNLGSKAQYQLWFDGVAVKTNTTGTFELTGVDRGAHQFSVKLLDNKGKTLASSSEQTLYYHKPSVLMNRN